MSFALQRQRARRAPMNMRTMKPMYVPGETVELVVTLIFWPRGICGGILVREGYIQP
jgi:hypothetical protein